MYEEENGYELVNKMNSSSEDIPSSMQDERSEPPPLLGDNSDILDLDTSRKGPRDWFVGCNPEVVSLIFWECPRRSGVVFVTTLALLLCFACYSLVSIVAYSALLLLIATFSFRLYKTVQGTISAKHASDSHPLKALFELDLTLKPQQLSSMVEPLCDPFNRFVIRARSILLVENFADSTKFAGLMFALTYIGACFNALTLLILIWVALFVFPKSYEKNQELVDALVGQLAMKVRQGMHELYAAVEPKVSAAIDRLPPAARNAIVQVQGKADDKTD